MTRPSEDPSQDHQKIPENSTHRKEIDRYITLWPSHDASARSHWQEELSFKKNKKKKNEKKQEQQQ